MWHSKTRHANASGSKISPSSIGGCIKLGELGQRGVEETGEGAATGGVVGAETKVPPELSELEVGMGASGIGTTKLPAGVIMIALSEDMVRGEGCKKVER